MTRIPTGTMELHFKSITGRDWKLLLLHYTKNWYSTSPKPLLAENPISWQSNGSDSLTTVVRGCTGNISFVVDGKSITRERFNDFFNTQKLTDLRFELYREIQIGKGDYYKYPNIQGFVKTESAEQPLQPYPYEVELPVMDALAAGDEMRPANFMDRCAMLGYRFTMKNVLEWWMEDMDIGYLQVLAKHDSAECDLEKPTAYTADFMEITENINMSPFNDIRAKTYSEIFEKLLGTNRIYFKGYLVEIHRGFTSDSDHVTRWRLWTSNGDGTLNNENYTWNVNPMLLTEAENFTDTDHSARRVPQRSTHYTRPALRKEDVSLSIDFDKNREISGQSTSNGYLWGQGNLISHGDVSMQRNQTVNIDSSSMRASVDTSTWLAISPNNGNESVALATVKPVAFSSVDKMLLTGRLVKRKLIRESTGAKAVYRTENDYDNVLQYSLQWGGYYYNGAKAGRDAWGTIEHRLDLKMVKDYKNSDTSNFYDGMTDPTPNEETAFSKMINCEEYNVANYEGIHILDSPRYGNDRNECAQITLRIYGTNSTTAFISALSLKSINEDVGDYTYGDIVNGDEIGYMQGGDELVSVWSGQGHYATTISKFSNIRTYTIIASPTPMVSYSGKYYSVVGFSFNPRNDAGDIYLI